MLSLCHGSGCTSRRLALTFGAILCLSTASAARAETAENVVLQWNDALLQAVRNTGFAPMWTARALAVTHTSMYDAWAAYDARAVGTRLGGALRRPEAERTEENKETAVSFAAYRALVDLFPSQRAALFDPLMASLGYNPADLSTDLGTPAGVGNVAAAAVLAFRHADGANQLGDLAPGAYADYTGYQPVNDPFTMNDPGRWQPLLNANATTQRFLAPHWGRVVPFALQSPSQFRPPAPAPFGSKAFEKQSGEIVRLSANLDDRRKLIASYWADGPRTETPPGHWNLFAQFVSRRDGHTLDEDVKMFFALGNALLDASISVWDCKVEFDYVRPVSAVRYLYAGKNIEAWAGPGLGTRPMLGQFFNSYIGTPPFAEYTSGHSAFSAAAATVLALFTGSDAFGGSVTFPAGSSPIEPGVVPASELTLSWATFTEAANEAGVSRRYGGIHFKDGDLESRRMGRRIGALVWERVQFYLSGRNP